jgi:uncharacterized tellurite resistance protein B-like protein
MALINFSSLKNMMTNHGQDNDARALFEEVLLLVLARASRVDSNIESIEVRHVQKALKEMTGAEYSEAEVQTAASSEIFETQSLERTLAKASGNLSSENKAEILHCLAELLQSDDAIRHPELEFFDHVAAALRASPSEIAGLQATDG